MFSNLTISLLFAFGFSAWVYSKAYRSSGGNTVNSLVIAGGGGLVVFLGMLALLGALF